MVDPSERCGGTAKMCLYEEPERESSAGANLSTSGDALTMFVLNDELVGKVLYLGVLALRSKTRVCHVMG